MCFCPTVTKAVHECCGVSWTTACILCPGNFLIEPFCTADVSSSPFALGQSMASVLLDGSGSGLPAQQFLNLDFPPLLALRLGGRFHSSCCCQSCEMRPTLMPALPLPFKSVLRLLLILPFIHFLVCTPKAFSVP